MRTDRLHWLLSHLSGRAWQEVDARQIARVMIGEGVLDSAFAAQALENYATIEVRRLLKRRDKNGVPYFGNIVDITSTGKAVRRYKQVEFFAENDFRTVIEDHVKRGRREVQMARVFAEELRRRFGIQMRLPILTEADSEMVEIS